MENQIIDKLNQFFSQYQKTSFSKGETIVDSDDEFEAVYFLLSGNIRMYSITESGSDLTLNIFKPGSYISMMWAIADLPNTYYFEAMTEVEAWKAPKKEFLEFAKKNPEVLFELTKRILVGMNGLLVRMEYLLAGKAYPKVASVILLSARRFGEKRENGEILINLTMTHELIASLAGLTRETTSIEMKNLEKNNLVRYEDHLIVVMDIEKLKEASLLYSDEKPLPYTF
jgi:CRP/FNR family transcriptional regulator, cyclic AMP receptor protein